MLKNDPRNTKNPLQALANSYAQSQTRKAKLAAPEPKKKKKKPTFTERVQGGAKTIIRAGEQSGSDAYKKNRQNMRDISGM